MPVPKVKSSNWLHWCDFVKRLVITKTAVVFLLDLPTNYTVIEISALWTNKSKETAPHITTAPRDTPLTILKAITLMACTNRKLNLMNVITKIWTFQTHKDISIQSFLKEDRNQVQDLMEHITITPEVEYQMQYLFLSHITTLQIE